MMDPHKQLLLHTNAIPLQQFKNLWSNLDAQMEAHKHPSLE